MQREVLSSENVRAVVTLAERGSFSRAAASLGISQPSMSQQIRRIEKELGRKLFKRSAHGLSITPDGEAFPVFARVLLDIGDAARRHFDQPTPSRVPRIGLLEGVARTLLMRVLAIFSEQFPAFAFDITCGPGHRLFSEFDEDRYDVVISAATSTMRRGKLLRRFPLVWIGSKDVMHVCADTVPLVLPPAPDGLRDAALSALSEAGRTWHINVQSESLTVIEAAVAAGLGVSVMVPYVRLYEAVPIDPASGYPPLSERELVIEHRRSSVGDERVDAMYQLLRSAFQQVIGMRLSESVNAQGVRREWVESNTKLL